MTGSSGAPGVVAKGVRRDGDAPSFFLVDVEAHGVEDDEYVAASSVFLLCRLSWFRIDRIDKIDARREVVVDVDSDMNR